MNYFFVILTLLCFFSVPASAEPILNFSQLSQDILIGETAKVDIVISGVTSPIGKFEIGVKFNNLILQDQTGLQPTEVVFSTFLGNPGHDSTCVWGVNKVDAPNIVMVREYAHDFNITADELWNLQSSGSFTLASLFFKGLTVGTSELEFSYFYRGGGRPAQPIFIGGPEIPGTGTWPALDFSLGPSASINVNNVNAPVPLPSAVLLLGAGLSRLVLYGRRKQTDTN